MIYGALILALLLIAQLPSPHNWVLGVTFIVLVIPRVLRWARAQR